MLSSAKKSTNTAKSPSENAENVTNKRKGLFAFLRRKTIAQEDLPRGDINATMSRALRSQNYISTRQEYLKKDQKKTHEALAAIEAAIYVLDRASDIIDQSIEVTISATLAKEPGARAMLAESYDELRLSIDAISPDAEDKCHRLLGTQSGNMEIEMPGRARYCVAGFRLDTSEAGLNLKPPVDAFSDPIEIDDTLQHLKTAKAKVARISAAYCRDAQFLMSRLRELEADHAIRPAKAS